MKRQQTTRSVILHPHYLRKALEIKMTDYSLLALLHCVFIMCVCVQLQQAWGAPENKRAATKVERAFV